MAKWYSFQKKQGSILADGVNRELVAARCDSIFNMIHNGPLNHKTRKKKKRMQALRVANSWASSKLNSAKLLAIVSTIDVFVPKFLQEMGDSRVRRVASPVKKTSNCFRATSWGTSNTEHPPALPASVGTKTITLPRRKKLCAEGEGYAQTLYIYIYTYRTYVVTTNSSTLSFPYPQFTAFLACAWWTSSITSKDTDFNSSVEQTCSEAAGVANRTWHLPRLCLLPPARRPVSRESPLFWVSWRNSWCCWFTKRMVGARKTTIFLGCRKRAVKIKSKLMRVFPAPVGSTTTWFPGSLAARAKASW